MQNYNSVSVLVIVAMCALVLLIGVLKRKSEWLFHILIRGVFGTISICAMNQFCVWQGLQWSIGLNPATILTSTILGFPGVALMYGINIYHSL